jgi:hypothetical protein
MKIEVVKVKKFEVEVTRTDKYIIEIDEEKFNQEWIDCWKNVFIDLDTLEEHAENIAVSRARFKSSFIEGYGIPLINGHKPPFIKNGAVEEGINIKLIDEDDDWYTTVKEIN